MKKILKSSFDRIPYAHLYQDDLEKIIELIKEQLPEITYSDNEYEYASLDEIKEKRGAKIMQLEIAGRVPDRYSEKFRINIDGRKIWLHADSACEPLWHQVKSFVATKVTWQEKLTFPWLSGWLFLTLIVEYFSFVDIKAKTFLPPIWYHVLVVSSSLFFVFSLWQLLSNNGVTLERRHAITGFFKRNFDRLLMLLIGGLLTLLGKFILGWLSGNG